MGQAKKIVEDSGAKRPASSEELKTEIEIYRKQISDKIKSSEEAAIKAGLIISQMINKGRQGT